MSQLQRILYVEDEPDLQQIVKLALEAVGGFTVAVCGSAREAVEEARRFEPDLILLDYLLPEMDGKEALALLRRTPGLERVPVIFVTARVQSPEVEDYKRCGAIGVIPKPFDPMSLAAGVSDLWKRQGPVFNGRRS
jgi:CheY-like chemotaxis protein